MIDPLKVTRALYVQDQVESQPSCKDPHVTANENSSSLWIVVLTNK